MLETADLDRKLTRKEYQLLFPPLQERLRRLQYALHDAEVATVIAFEGWDASGKGAIIQRLSQRLDPRAFRAWPGTPPTGLERRFHFLWRYQNRLPEDGQMAVFDQSWYGRVLADRVEKAVRKPEWRVACTQINQFERWLADDGQVVVKFWFHVSQKEQRRRLDVMARDPAESWRVEKEAWRQNRRYGRWQAAVREMIEKTDTPNCPWTVVAATDDRWTRVQVFETLVSRMEQALEKRQRSPAAVSRTHLAEAATRGARQRRDAEEEALVRSVAADAGLPVDERED